MQPTATPGSNTKSIADLVDEIQQAHGGDPWHGPSRAHVLGEVTVAEAARQPG